MKNILHKFKTDVSSIEKPLQFNFPFYYQPHELAIIAAQELQAYLQLQTEWFSKGGLQEAGKMFGVLVVENSDGDLYYIAGFSGKLAGKTTQSSFVPPVYELERVDEFFKEETNKLDLMTQELQKLESDAENNALVRLYNETVIASEQKLEFEKQRIQSIKRKRRILLKEKKQVLSDADYDVLQAQQRQFSLNDSFFLKEFEVYTKQRTLPLEKSYNQLQSQLEILRKERRDGSNWLQDWLFDEYNFLNAKGEIKNVKSIFQSRIPASPPAATGDCAAPKLLQFAYKNDLSPITMAEFWYGKSPKSKIRKHGNYYPACRSKCEPVLEFMLQGIDVEDNPLLQNPAVDKELEIIYEDEFMLAVNKPAEFLSVPGKNIADCVQSRMKKKYPDATGPMIVHRLDMSTSGILLIAKTLEVYHNLQEQFTKRTVQKRYVAVLNGIVETESGYINLPLRVDLDNRPYQLVDFEYGKSARTKFEVVEQLNGKTRVYFFPITGRTHQLRVHAAHVDGLNTPILGDDLYGIKDSRLFLHAEKITFIHPISKKRTTITQPADF